MTEEELIIKLNEFRRLPAETEVFEFKEARNNYDSNKLGKYFSALSNEAILKALSEHDETADILYDKTCPVQRNGNGNPEPNPDLRDYENVPLNEDKYEYFEREVKPHLPNAWIDDKCN